MKTGIWRILLTAVLLTALLLTGCGRRSEPEAGEPAAPDVGFVANESYMMDFTVREGKVQIRCVLSLVNRGTEPCSIRIYGDFPNDVGTLLAQERLTAQDGETGSETFTLEPGAVTEVGVLFIGDFGGTMQMSARLLPTLYWEDADNPGDPQPLQAYARNR